MEIGREGEGTQLNAGTVRARRREDFPTEIAEENRRNGEGKDGENSGDGPVAVCGDAGAVLDGRSDDFQRVSGDRATDVRAFVCVHAAAGGVAAGGTRGNVRA